MFRGTPLGEFRADLIVDWKVIVEFKAVQRIDLPHGKQVLNYLKATSLVVGLIFNFGPKAEFRRQVFENQRQAKSRFAVTSNS